MTALAGLWSFGSAIDVVRSCERMLGAQQVYAPEPPATWIDGQVILGRRLFRILPEDMHDRGPTVSSDGGRVLVADIRLDNRDELTRELGISTPDARRLSDAAILMRGIERWNEGAIERLVGDFAFALWDANRQRLTLARDLMGHRPLHYHRCACFFAFASMPKGLHALPDVPRAPDKRTAGDLLTLMPELGSASYFEGVERIEPGAVMTVTRDGLSARRHWNPSIRELRLPRDEDYEEALREQVDRAVGACLRGARYSVAAEMSGGLDSSTVAATAARLLEPTGGRVVAFTAVPREGYPGKAVHGAIADEGPFAAAVAALHPNMEHVLIRSNGRSPLADLDRYFFLFERPLLNLCNGVWSQAILAEAQDRGLSVILTGAAGNMTLSYDGMALLSRLARHGRFVRLTREIYRLRRTGTRYGAIAAQALGPFLPAALWRGIARLRGKGRRLEDYSALRANDAGHCSTAKRAASRGLDVSYRPRGDPLELRLWTLGRVDSGNYRKGIIGGWGIEARDPTADRRLIEFCLSVPVEQYLARGLPRSLARRAFADRLPQVVRLERRKGYQAADWHESLTAARAELKEELHRLADVPAAADVVDTKRLLEWMEEWPETGWEEERVIERYRLATLRGIAVGHFLRSAAGANR